MTEIGLQLGKAGYQLASSSYERIRVAAPSREILLLGAFLILLQVLDGVLTGIGVYHFGTDAEGNPLLHYLMHSLGYIPALAITKSVAIAIILVLCFLSTVVEWLTKALKVVILIYLGAAIVPWSVILLSRVYLA